ncbi:biotin synthase auxiliary protein BsaP [Corynebacterium otitidis]
MVDARLARERGLLGELTEAVVLGDAPKFHPYSGGPAADATRLSPGAAAGLEPPRYCQLCGRRMKVQVRPSGWQATCSRHGSLDSELLE